MSSDIPIDIHLGQLLEWLISRRHCNKDWHLNLQKIRDKISSLFPRLSEDPSWKEYLSSLPSVPADVNYLHCKQLLENLSGTEHGAKNLLGQYQSPITKELAEIIKMYEKDNIYLAELSQIVYRNITYELPFIKKRIQKLDQTAAESSKKAEDCTKNAKGFREQYMKECTALGIEGRNIQEELIQEAKILPHLYDNIARRSAILAPVCKYVEEFILTVHKGNWIQDQSSSKLFPLLHHLMTHGNKPYPLNEEPKAADNSANAAVMEDAPRTGPEEDTESSKASLDVNLNDTIADHLNELNGSSVSDIIDFDIQDSGNDTVNWDLETDGLSITVEESAETSFRNILDNAELRTQITNELHELLAFLSRRLEEQSTEDTTSELLSIQVGNSRLVSDKKMVQQLIGNVREVLDLFNDHRLQSLCKLHDSVSFLDRLTKQLEQKLTFADRVENKAESFQIQKIEALDEREKLQPEIATLTDETKALQKFVEQEISRKYNDRRVSILGGI